VGELGVIHRYSYWSEQRVRAIADDNNIDLNRRWLLSFKTPDLPALPGAQFAEERRTIQRHEIAQRIERAIGQIAVEDFVTPPPASFAKGQGPLTFTVYVRRYGKKKRDRKAVLVHTRATASDGTRVEVCLFASIENCAGYLNARKAHADGWSSSSEPAMEEFIFNHTRMYDDPEDRAIDLLWTIYYSDFLTSRDVFKRFDSAEWFAEVYRDIEINDDRSLIRPDHPLIPGPVNRIVIGAPLWIRSDGG
jgi:hypothetical protein